MTVSRLRSLYSIPSFALALVLATTGTGVALASSPTEASLATVPKSDLSDPPPPLRADGLSALSAYGGELPLGSPALDEQRFETELAPGVTHTRITRGRTSEVDVYTVDVLLTRDCGEARSLAKELERDGFGTRVQKVGPDIPDREDRANKLGCLVRTGAYETKAEAQALRNVLKVYQYPAEAVRYTGEDGRYTTGPWTVNVLEVDAEDFEGTVEARLANDIVPGVATVPEIAQDNDALAAVNGGFFWVFGDKGVTGQLSGVSMTDGQLVSGQEPSHPNADYVDVRSALVLYDGKNGKDLGGVEGVGTQLKVEAPNASTTVDGLNRKPLANEMVQLTHHGFGSTSRPAAEKTPYTGVEVAIDNDGNVVETRAYPEEAGDIPYEGSTLIGTGVEATWLLENAAEGTRVDIEHSVSLEDGTKLPKTALGLVNGGPNLVTSGEVDVRSTADGWAPDISFYYRTSVNRHQRTIGGVDEEGDLLLITFDGRNPGVDAGASLFEAARVAISLGATEALNLDGGGSTTMTVGDETVTKHDVSSMREVADAVVIRP